MRKNTKEIGDRGEEQAKAHLLENGYLLLETNWRHKKYELDIIAKINQTIVFIEVKTRKNNTFGEPELSVTKKKQHFLIAAAQQYVITNNIEEEFRFDIIAITNNSQNKSIQHLESAFYPSIK
jgi:putative endonuclease